MTITVPLEHVKQILNLKETEDVKSQLEKVYNGLEIEIKDNTLNIHIDDIYTLQEESYNYLVNLCDNAKFDKALKVAEELYLKYKQSSELNRIIAQIHLNNTKPKDAESYLIEALKLNPKNTNALILMGNLQYQKEDLETALMYWNAALRFNPDDYLALSNIGSTLAKDNHLNQAKNFFEEALSIKADFSNALLGLGIINNKQDKHTEAFKLAIKVLKTNSVNTPLYDNAINLAINSAKALCIENTKKIEEEIENLKTELEKRSEKPIKVVTDANIETPAKISIAEYHNKAYHELIYKQSDAKVQHLILHELHHLKMVLEARETDSNQLFTSLKKHQDAFYKANQKYIQKLKKQGVPEPQIDKLITSVFHGLNSQIYNSSIDLFIEDLIFKNYAVFKPLQFISLINLIEKGIEATTSPLIIKSFPKSLISKSKILNLVNALHLKDLYGIDKIADFKPSKIERSQATDFFKEFEEYRNDKEPGEEYEIIQHWAEDLNIDQYFQLEQEKTKTSKTPDEVLDEINKDPYGLDSPEPQYIIDERQKFIDQHANKDTNKAVTFYMVGAIGLLSKKPKEEVKNIALEFAQLGMTGIDVKKNNYEVPSLNKTMSGYQTLAYYYVSWAIAIPEMLAQLQLPFDKEYGLANRISKNNLE